MPEATRQLLAAVGEGDPQHELVLATDWAATPLGPVGDWSDVALMRYRHPSGVAG